MFVRSTFQQSVSVGVDSWSSEQVAVNVVFSWLPVLITSRCKAIHTVSFLCHVILILVVSCLAELRYTNSPNLLSLGDPACLPIIICLATLLWGAYYLGSHYIHYIHYHELSWIIMSIFPIFPIIQHRPLVLFLSATPHQTFVSTPWHDLQLSLAAYRKLFSAATSGGIGLKSPLRFEHLLERSCFIQRWIQI